MLSDTAASAKKKAALPFRLPELKPAQDIVDATRLFAANLVIKTPEGYERAAKQLVDLKEEIDRIEKEKDSVFKPINAGLRAFSALVVRALSPLKQYEISIKAAMIRYSDEQDRIRQDQQRIANERAETERKRLQEIADRAAAKGQDGKAEVFAERAQAVVAPIAQQAAPKVAGISIPKVWTFEITDEDLIPREYLDVSEVRIRKVVTALKGDTKIPGVRVFEQKRIAAGVV
jgi:hypothetical protein